MRRVAIVGCGGSGKSVLARELGRRTGLPVIHLDTLFWSPDWQPTPPDEWRAIQERLVAEERWIIDGNYGGTMELRLAAADTVVFLDLPTHVCLRRVILRRLRSRFGAPRPDLGAEDRLTIEFLRWIAGYRRTRRPGILRRLAALNETRVVILRSDPEVRAFLDAVPPS
jgi:adenylate kinase family enzyme